MGLPIDGYDYSQHLKVIDGSGTFIGPNGKIVDPMVKVFNKITHVSDEPMIDRNKQLEAIALDTKAMPKDIRMALDGGDEESFEELLDDFVVEASKKTMDEDEEDGEGKKVFDFKKYYASIMKEHGDGSKSKDDHFSEDDEEFDTDDEDDDDNNNKHVHETKRMENRLLDDHFDAVIKRYNDMDIGELDEDDPRMQEGLISMDNNQMLEDALEEFEKFNRKLLHRDNDVKKNDDVDNAIASAISKTKGSSLMGIDENDSSSEEEEEDDDEEEEEKKEDDDDIRTHSWFQRKEKAQWDCETILSTYSNLDNRPKTIAMKDARQGMHRIRLSKKTGLPLAPKSSNSKKSNTKKNDSRLDCNEADEDTIAQALQSLPMMHNDEEFESLVVPDQDIYIRRKGETKEEKKERKRRVKAERRARRAQKKEMKNAFKKAENLVKRHETTDKTSGRTVRRYE